MNEAVIRERGFVVISFSGPEIHLDNSLLIFSTHGCVTIPAVLSQPPVTNDAAAGRRRQDIKR